MALNSIYRKYFQKSRVFVYPLLGIKRGSAVIPEETYLSWNNMYETEDRKLICLYPNRTDESFKLFNKNIILSHKRLLNIYKLSDTQIVFVFDFNDLKDDWTNIVNGKYSRIQPKIKNKILNFYDKNSGNYKYVESYLYPKKYFKTYADLLGTEESYLEKVGELCSLPDYEKECLTLEYANLQEID